MIEIALAGNPNCGKTALFNKLTGSKQKVSNYAGVTVEKKEGFLKLPTGEELMILDLPGAYSLIPHTPDEVITHDVVKGMMSSIRKPSALITIVDATALERGLGFVLELLNENIPSLLAVNMMDIAEKLKINIDLPTLEKELGIPVFGITATNGKGVSELLFGLSKLIKVTDFKLKPENVIKENNVQLRFKRVDEIISVSLKSKGISASHSLKIDRIILHPIWGTLLFVFIVLAIFQSVFKFASIPADFIESSISQCGALLSSQLPDGALKSLLIDGVIAGVGSVLVFLPQILILFSFILVLEDSGYMARAAFLMDRLMGKVGLHGRAFIPLLSSFACAIPGVMATRTIENKRDRLTTIMVAPLMTCSARLPIYTLLISAFIPEKSFFGFLSYRGLVMFSLYFGAIILALSVAFLFKFFFFKSDKPPLILELPSYKWPSTRNLWVGLKDRSIVFLKRAGTVILSISIILWFLSTYPKAPEHASESPITYSYAGKIGKAIEPLVKPIGFDWRIAIALIPGFAAREVMVSALATVYSIESKDSDDASEKLSLVIKKEWSLPTALSLLAWYIVALQCLSTVAVVKRETNGWKWPMIQLFYLTVLAYGLSFTVFRVSTFLIK